MQANGKTIQFSNNVHQKSEADQEKSFARHQSVKATHEQNKDQSHSVKFQHMNKSLVKNIVSVVNVCKLCSY